MLVVFLDLDGVMVPAVAWKPVELLEDGFLSFNKTAIKSLSRIIRETGASIVLTSTHKSKYNIDQWERIFISRGISTSINKLNDNSLGLNRRDEILTWLSNNLVEKFVIIDDDKSLNELPDKVKSKLVLTSSLVGLNDECADVAIQVLKS